MLALLLTALVAGDKYPFCWPSGLPEPLAYYWLNEGSGTALKESVSGKADAGQIDHIITDQPNGAYPGPTWVKDDTAFGDVLQCGSLDKSVDADASGGYPALSKDIVWLEDVDYGKAGSFTLNFWVRNPVGSHFVDSQREQLFGHCDADGSVLNTTDGKMECPWSMCPHNVHMQIELNGNVRTLVTDGDDETGAPGGGSDTNWTENGGILHESDEWHMVTITTKPDGTKGHSTYYDGEVLSGIPDVLPPPDGLGVGVNKRDYEKGMNANGGDPIDPTSDLHFCGRKLSGQGRGSGATFNSRRYSNVELAHFSAYNEAMTAADVKKLLAEYKKRFFPVRAQPTCDVSPSGQSYSRSGFMVALCLWLTSFVH